MKKPEEINILIGCEESQAVCNEFRKLGFNAFSCDLQECSGGHPEWHLQIDIFEAIKIKKWDAVISFPPCTDLAVSGAAWFKIKRESGEQKRSIKFFFDVWKESNCCENPVGILNGGKYIKKWFPELHEEMVSEGFPFKPTQIIEPYMFGDNANKKTCLWLKNLPELKPTDVVCGSKYITATSGRRYPEWCWNTGKGCGSKRSKTYPGIAKAMAEQWGKYLINNL